VSYHDLKRLGNDWLEVTQSRASNFLVRTLQYDLVYGTELMNTGTAERLVGLLFAYFDCNVRCFCNTEGMPGPEPFVFRPIEGSNIDAGIVCVSERYIAIVWIGDNS